MSVRTGAWSSALVSDASTERKRGGDGEVPNQGLAKELGADDIRVNAIAPGVVETFFASDASSYATGSVLVLDGCMLV